MAISDQTKIDLLYKKLFGVSRADTAAFRSPSNESIASPALLRGDNIWVRASEIPTTAASVPLVVNARNAATNETLSGVAITSTAGQFSCNASVNGLYVGKQISISGTFGGTGSITGYTSAKTYRIAATNGSTTFTLVELNGTALVTTAGTPTGLTYIATSVVCAYPDTTTVQNSSIYPTWKTGITDWIPPEFDTANATNTYRVKVYIGNSGLADPATTGGTAIYADGSGGAGEWYFDYQSGLLSFIGSTPNPAGITASSVIYIYGYTYVGPKGIQNQTNTSVGNLNISGNTIAATNTNGDINLTSLGSGSIKVTNTTESTNSSIGSFLVAGGVGISKKLNVAGITTIENTTQSTTYADGALIVKGGVGIALNLNVHGAVDFDSTLNIDGITTLTNNATSTSSTNGALIVTGGTGIGGALNVAGNGYFTSNTGSTNSTSGALVVTGGAGISEKLNVGGQLKVFDATDSNSYTEGSLILNGGAGIAKNLTVNLNTATGSLSVNNNASITGALTVAGNTTITNTASDALTVAGGVGISKTLNVAGITSLTNTTDSTLTSNGALVVTGGVGIAKNLNVGGTTNLSGNLIVNGTATFNNGIISTTSTITEYEDSILDLHKPKAGYIISNDGKDVGIKYQYFDDTEDYQDGIITTASFNANTVTLTVNGVIHPVGSIIVVSGLTNAAWNGTWVVTANDTSAKTITYACTTSGSTLTNQYALVYRKTYLDITSSSIAGTTLTVNYASINGGIAALTTGNTITLSGLTPSSYNGTYTIASNGTTSFTVTVVNNGALTVQTGKIYVSTRYAFAGLANDSGAFEFYRTGTETASNTFSGIYGDLKGGSFTALPHSVVYENEIASGLGVRVPAKTVYRIDSAASTTSALASAVKLDKITLAATQSSGVYTNASTLYIDGAPIAGSNAAITNSYAVHINSGDVLLDNAGTIKLKGASAGKLTIAGTDSATNTTITFPVENSTTGKVVVDNYTQTITNKTFTTGNTWQGNTIAAIYGGTGLNTFAAGDILYATSSTTLARLAKGNDGEILQLTSGLPTWNIIDGGTY